MMPIKLFSLKTVACFILSLLIVAFGQPAYVWWLGPVAASFGYAIFLINILEIQSKKNKFWMGSLWFFCVQLVQLYWFVSHPYSYIYPFYFFVCAVLGVQFGVVCRYVTTKNISSFRGVFGIASLWVLLEWARLFILSGFSFNPVGIALTTTLYSLQMASIGGIYLLSLWVIVVNLLALNAWESKFSFKSSAVWAVVMVIPYTYGVYHYHAHANAASLHATDENEMKAILVQTAFPAEEALGIDNQAEFIAFVIDEWNQILKITKQHKGKETDLIVLPEFVVPLGTYTFVYPYSIVKESFEKHYGKESLESLPPLEVPFAKKYETEFGTEYFVNNAYWSQAIANYFDAPILLGLEDVDEDGDGIRDYYSAALMLKPQHSLTDDEIAASGYACPFCVDRYEKRVLVPMGEYIPFEFLREMAKDYGVYGSFTFGKDAKVLNTGKFPIGVSICYEETFGDLMRESRQNGAEVLVNLTSDVWYPDSKLAQQHFDHARVRTVEAGVPLLRSCNTGITCAVDSLGRMVDSLDEYDGDSEWLSDSLYVKVPTYHYKTLYSDVGDSLVIGLCLMGSFGLFFRFKK